jgi:hypothetical protein
MKRWKVWAALRRPKDMKGKDEISGDWCLLYVFRVDSVDLNQFNLRKGGSAGRAVGVVVYVWDWILVRDGSRVKGSIDSIVPPTAVVLRHEMVGGRPRAIGSLSVQLRSIASNSTLVTSKRPGDVCGML